jgi:hypothetical protein
MRMLCSDCYTQDSGGVPDHKGGLFGSGMFCQHNEIAFIFAIVIIDNDNHLSAAEAIECLKEIIRHESPPLKSGALHTLPEYRLQY